LLSELNSCKVDELIAEVMADNESSAQLARRNELYENWLGDLESIKADLRKDLETAISNIKKEHFHPAILFGKDNPTDLVAKYGVFESIHCIIHRDLESALNFNCPEWESSETFCEALRNANPTTLAQEWLERKLKRIQGGSGIPQNDGDVYQAIGKNGDKYECIVAFIEALSVLLQTGLLHHKESSIRRRIQENNDHINRAEIGEKLCEEAGLS
jgi:hypothetical protein